MMLGIVSFCGYRYVTESLNTFDIEMEAAMRELMNRLALVGPRVTADSASTPNVPEFCRNAPTDIEPDKSPFRHGWPVAGVVFVLAWLAQAARYFFQGDSPLADAVQRACIYAPLVLSLSFLIACPFWIRLSRCRPGLLAPLASFVCLLWNLAEFLLGMHVL